jgi:beta-glucosidase-like glycosyl hydrolase/CubicO group peptidase (beta-lactamase class C family)
MNFRRFINIVLIFFFVFISQFILGLSQLNSFSFVENKIDKKEAKQKIEEANKFVFKLNDSIQQKKWVDSVYQNLTLEEKIGQLFMVAAYSNKAEVDHQKLDELITKQHIGGLIFFQGGPHRQARLTNRFQSKAKVPLLIGIDAEWGLSMRLDSTYVYPWNMTLGAIKDNKLVEKFGQQMAQQCKRLGVHFTFGPVVDINTNPKNPIIGNRSFGEDKFNVAEKAIAYMTGLQNEGVFATAKHFPGHGDTDKDSHHTLPTVGFSKERIYDTELFPYVKLIEKDLASVMVAHLNVPSLEKRANFPSSISYDIVTEILKKELNFKGLIFTDALNMKGASNFKSPGEIDLEAFRAGNDILLFPENVPLAIQKIKDAIEKEKDLNKRLEESVKKILKYKFKANLHQIKPIVFENLSKDLNKPEFDALNKDLFVNAIVNLKNENEILPIQKIDSTKIAYVKLGDDTEGVFLEKLNTYAKVTQVKNENLNELLKELKDYNTVIIGYHKLNGPWKKHHFTQKELTWLYEIARENNIIFTAFAKPYLLNELETTTNFESMLLAHQNTTFAQEAAAEAIFGANDISGKLPVSINEDFKAAHGIEIKSINRLGFAVPERVDMNSKILLKIDSIANYAINNQIAPGMQILVARKGKVIYQKAFGHHLYDKKQNVNLTDLYDVASLTKITSTLPLIMQDYDKGILTDSSRLGQILPYFKNTNKENLRLDDILLHQAKLKAWIPFYKVTLDCLKQPSKKYYSPTWNQDFSVKVANDLYLRRDYQDTILKKIADSDLLGSKKYVYSDFAFIILKEYLEKKHKKAINQLIDERFFKKIGCQFATYKPLYKFDAMQIVPSEDDNYFRHQLIHGHVHDMAAAMQGGIAGHAGLFSNALDMAKIMQMYLNKGQYGGYQFFKPETFDHFNTCHGCDSGNRRGLGFDKPQLDGGQNPTCGCTSKTSFGHTGFTGAIAWADPEKELVYVLLSNRTYPNHTKNALSKQKIREKIQQVIYDAIIK